MNSIMISSITVSLDTILKLTKHSYLFCLIIFIDYVNGGDLFTHFYKRNLFKKEEVQIIIAEVVLAKEQLHKLGIIYRDLKIENISIDCDGHIVDTDFGLSKEFTKELDGRYSFCGTVSFHPFDFFFLKKKNNT